MNIGSHSSEGLKKLVIFGAAFFDLIKLIDAINRATPTWQILGFIDDNPELRNKNFLGYKVMGGRELIMELAGDEHTYFFNNVPTFPKCKQIAEILLDNSCRVANLVHPLIDMNYVDLGYGCILPEGCVVGSGAKIGSFVTVRLRSLISHDVEVEDFVFVGPGATIGGHAVLKKGCFIGAAATVMGKTTVGEGSIVGAGAVVTRDVADHVTVAGVPAAVMECHGQE